MANSLRDALRFVERALPKSEISDIRPVPSSSEERKLDDEIEAQINEDAEAAAPTASFEPASGEEADKEPEEARTSLAAVPPLGDSGPPTQAWQAEPMTIFSEGGERARASFDGGAQPYGRHGPEWTG